MIEFSFISPDTIDYSFRLFVALALGLILGAERVFAQKKAGMRTYALVSMGAALFVIIAQIVSDRYLPLSNFDPLRVASQVVVGLGFIGAGLIIFRDSGIQGLTTAAGLWVAGGIGIASGYALYGIAVVATFFTLLIFTFLWVVEQKFKSFLDRLPSEGDERL